LRRAATALLCLAVLAPGCGSDDAKDVRKAVRDFVQATNDGDPRACDQLVTQRYLEQQTAQAGEAAKDACREQLKTLRGVEVTLDRFVSVKVDGDKATALVDLRSGNLKDKRTIELAREGGRWRLDGGKERR
jgi:predicted lipid-binding transport protein (Tim44 family)